MADSAQSATFPLSTDKLSAIAEEACEQTIGEASKYEHDQAAKWNEDIINAILKKLLADITDNESKQSPYKFVVNSTIIQHSFGPSETSQGRRGMHSAVGAYWDNTKDGMWSYKWDSAEKRGMDAVISITWIKI